MRSLIFCAMNLSEKTLQYVERLLPRYPQKRSAMLMILHAIQEDLGYISKEAVEWTAQKLEVTPIAVYEVVTFYPMFRQAPIGRRHVKVCRTLSCALRGAYKVCDTLQEELACGLGETSADGNFTLEFVECVAACGSAPVVMVDNQLLENVSPDKAHDLAAKLKKETTPAMPPSRY
jgi:NADH-quinone oxidoreductase subunit E